MRHLKNNVKIFFLMFIFYAHNVGHINIHLEQPLNIPFKQPLLGVITI